MTWENWIVSISGLHGKRIKLVTSFLGYSSLDQISLSCFLRTFLHLPESFISAIFLFPAWWAQSCQVYSRTRSTWRRCERSGCCDHWGWSRGFLVSRITGLFLILNIDDSYMLKGLEFSNLFSQNGSAKIFSISWYIKIKILSPVHKNQSYNLTTDKLFQLKTGNIFEFCLSWSVYLHFLCWTWGIPRERNMAQSFA